MINKYITTFIMLLLSISICSGDSKASSESPLEQVQVSIQEVISILQNERYQDENLFAERRKLVIDAISKRFNFQLMAKLSLGKTWNSITSDEKNKFIELFSELLKSAYIRRVEGYKGEKVSYPKQKIKDDRAVVYSVFVKNNTELSVIYKLKKSGYGQWLVYDVIIEGASIIKQYRRQFAQIVKKEKFSGLISRLEEKIELIKKS